jgi:hypothetical protein
VFANALGVSLSPSCSPSFQPPLAGFAANGERAVVAVYAGKPCASPAFDDLASANCSHLIPLSIIQHVDCTGQAEARSG